MSLSQALNQFAQNLGRYPKVQSIRRRRMNGESIASIARSENVSEPTVRKYLKAGDLSPRPPVSRRCVESVIDRYVPVIEQWLAEDRCTWRKQRHTATRIWERLRDEYGAEVSLSTVTRKVAQLRREFAAEREAGYLDLVWHPGEAQADFGEVCLWSNKAVWCRHLFWTVMAFILDSVGGRHRCDMRAPVPLVS